MRKRSNGGTGPRVLRLVYGGPDRRVPDAVKTQRSTIGDRHQGWTNPRPYEHREPRLEEDDVTLGKTLDDLLGNLHDTFDEDEDDDGSAPRFGGAA